MRSIPSFCLAHPKSSLFACGLVCGLPFCLPSLFFLSFAALMGCYFLLEHLCETKNKRYRAGFCFFCGYNLPIYCFFLWMHPLDSTGMPHALSLFVVIFAWLGITLVHSAVSALIFPLFARFTQGRPSLLSPLAFASLWTLFELLFEFGTFAFPWNRLALSLYRCTPFIQSASLFGSLFLSFLTVLIASLVAHAHRNKKPTGALLALVLFCLNLGYGMLTLALTPVREDSRRVALVQNDLLSGEAHAPGYVRELLDTYVSLSYDCAGSDILLWPEVAVPVNLSHSPDYEKIYADLSRELGAPILMGAIRSENGRQQNAVVAVDESGAYAHYAKRHLVPFGEYLPWRGFFDAVFPALGQLNQLDSDLAAGTHSAVMEVDGAKVGALVCFDSAFSFLSRDAVRDGAELLVLATNDSWFKDSPSTSQHLAQCVFRAVENRRSTAVSAYSGVSAFLSPEGEILSSLPALQKGTLSQELPLNDTLTLYTLVGDVPVVSLCLLSLLACLIVIKKGASHEL